MRQSLRSTAFVAGLATAPALSSDLPLENIVAWWKGENLNPQVNGDLMIDWADASGNGHTLTNQLNLRTFTNVLNGKPACRTQGGQNGYATSGNAIFNSITNEAEVFGVIRNTFTTTNDCMWGFGGAGDASYYPYQGDGKIYDNFFSSVRQDAITPSPSVTLTNAHLYNVSASGATQTWTARQNGNVILNNTSFTTFDKSRNYMVLGGASYPGSPHYRWAIEMVFFEVVLYKAVLTADKRAQVHRYFNSRYNLGLPG